MVWDQLIPLLEVEKVRRVKDAPHFIVIHVGGNDLGYTKGTVLIDKIRDGLALVMSMFPGAHIVFSEICQRRSWMRGACDAPGRLDKARVNVNRVVSLFMREAGMTVLRHANLRHRMPVYRRDRVHLNTLGNTVFMHNIVDHLRSLL